MYMYVCGRGSNVSPKEGGSRSGAMQQALFEAMEKRRESVKGLTDLKVTNDHSSTLYARAHIYYTSF